jgi:Mor family transcriptional regulator
MKYLKADQILPENLLTEVQKYIHGEMIYVPNPKGIRKKWGENSGNRILLNRRNAEIRRKFQDGLTIDQLAEEFCLSYDRVKKIIYSHT